MDQNNQITKSLDSKYFQELSSKFELMAVSGNEVTVYTSQENCIREDNLQLSSFVKTEFEEVVEPYEFYVGKFLKKGVIKKQVVKNVDKKDLMQLLRLTIIDVFNFYGREISGDNLKTVSDLVYKNYYWLKFSEFKLFVEKIKGGHWQQVHNMSPAVFMERLKQFSDDSLEIREQIAESQNKGLKDKEIEIPLSKEQKDEFSTFLKELADKIDRSEKAKASDKIHANAEQTNQYHKENEAFLQKLKDDGVPESEGIVLYENFRLRK